MRKSKVVAAILVLAMMASMMTPAMAATPRAQELADKLRAAHLFYGYGKDAAGQPIFGLDDAATRVESLVMLVRMLRVYNTYIYTRNRNFDTPFTDVPDWCEGEIWYAYSSGLTSGTSPTTFSPDASVTNTEFLVFALRALGYSSGTDYVWENAAVKAAELGVIKSGEYTDKTAAFTRGDMVILAYGALATRVKGSNLTLAETLGVNLNNLEAGYSPALGVYELDMMDMNNGEWLDTNDDKKEIYFASLPSGTLLKHEKLVYDSNDTIENNILNFAEILHVFDRGIKYNSRSKFMDVDGNKDIIIATTDDGKSVLIGVVPTFGCVYPTFDISNNSSGGDNLMILNAMAFFGGEEMAKAVYGLMMEHYYYRMDNDKIITDELAAEYGLTIKHSEEYMTSFKDAKATVSNGSQTWAIGYNTANIVEASRFSVKIYK